MNRLVELVEKRLARVFSPESAEHTKKHHILLTIISSVGSMFSVVDFLVFSNL